MDNTNRLTVATQNAIMSELELPYTRGSMDEQELVSLFKAHGWSYQVRIRRYGLQYIYARKREGARIVERYIAPLSKIDTLTQTQVINKLVTLPKTETAANFHSLHELKLTA